MMLRFSRVFAALTTVALLAACGSDSTAPQSAIIGNYTAFQWVTTGGSGQTNQLTIGSTLQISLAANGSTSGHMHVAASNGAPAADFDMAGTWHEQNNTVEFAQAADTFVRDLVFSLEPFTNELWDLVADGTFNGTAVHLTLRRT